MDKSNSKTPELQVKTARASEKELDELIEFMNTLRQLNDDDWFGAEFGESSTALIDNTQFDVQQIVSGYRMMLNNAFDPTLDYLDLNSNFKQAHKRFEEIQAVQIKLEATWQDFYQSMLYDETCLPHHRELVEMLDKAIEQMIAA